MSRDFPTGLASSVHFQRADGGMRLKKVRKSRLRSLQAGARRLRPRGRRSSSPSTKSTLFVITWSKLEIRDVRVSCADESVRADVVRPILEGTHWGNILLLDLAKIRGRLEADPWVKEARLRKVFPSSLEIAPRPPDPGRPPPEDAVILIDRDGVELEAAPPGRTRACPLLVDEAGFARGPGGQAPAGLDLPGRPRRRRSGSTSNRST